MHDIQHLLDTHVLVYPYLREEDGDPIYGSPVRIPAHIEYSTGRTVNSRGDEVTEYAVIYTNFSISERDKFTFADASGTDITRTAIKIINATDPLTGLYHHSEVTI